MNMKELFNKFRFSKPSEVTPKSNAIYEVEVSQFKPIYGKSGDSIPGGYGFRVSVVTKDQGEVFFLMTPCDFSFLYDVNEEKVYYHENDPTVEQRILQYVKDWVYTNIPKFSMSIPVGYFKTNSFEEAIKDTNSDIIVIEKPLVPKQVESTYSSKVKYKVSDVKTLAEEFNMQIKDCINIINSVDGDIDKTREIIKSQEQQKKKVATKAKLAKVKATEEIPVDTVANKKEKVKKPRKKSKKDISTDDTSKFETNPKQPISS